MRRLRQRFPAELVIIGVHSAKFPAERETENIRQAALRLGIEHPIVNDAAFGTWTQYAVRAWPTVVLIDPTGRIVRSEAGEIDAEDFALSIDELIAGFDVQRQIDDVVANQTTDSVRSTELLRFPSKLLATSSTNLFVADSGNHRILEIAVEISDGQPTGTVTRQFGAGVEGFDDGEALHATFNDPHGLVVNGGVLYVADTGNHAIRAVELATGKVRTVAGNGRKSLGRIARGRALEVSLRSPWALEIEDDALLIAMAGSHQIILVLDGEIGPFAGTGQEALRDGPRQEAAFNQPSDLAIGLDHLFVVDAEASAIRAVRLEGEPTVGTLVGRGLFEFGDVDGTGGEVRLQHPTGICFDGGMLYVADTYNNKIKVLDPMTGATRTLIGTGRAGQNDGHFTEAELCGPEGVTSFGGMLFIADTNNHAIRVADSSNGQISTLVFSKAATGN